MPHSSNPQFHRGTGQVICRDCPFTDAAGKQTGQCLDWSLDECPTVSTYREACEYAERAHYAGPQVGRALRDTSLKPVVFFNFYQIYDPEELLP